MFDISLYAILIQFATIRINSSIIRSANISINWDIMTTFIRENLETNKQLKLSPISLNLLHQAQKLENLDKDELIKLLVSLASIKTG